MALGTLVRGAAIVAASAMLTSVSAGMGFDG